MEVWYSVGMKTKYNYRRRYLQTLGKWMIKEKDKDEQHLGDWTPMRFVSKEEIAKNGTHRFGEYYYIEVRRINGLGFSYDLICTEHEGYHRVSKFEMDKILHWKKTLGYTTACAGGFPTHHRSGVLRRFDIYMSKCHNISREKINHLKWEKAKKKEAYRLERLETASNLKKEVANYVSQMISDGHMTKRNGNKLNKSVMEMAREMTLEMEPA